jgi:hypothetical protein
MPELPKPSRVTDFLKKVATPARLVFVVDATGSREATWDLAAKLQNEMFAEVARLGGLEVQLIYYRGVSEVSHSPWLTNGQAVAQTMSKGTMPGRSDADQAGARIRTSGKSDTENRRGGFCW